MLISVYLNFINYFFGRLMVKEKLLTKSLYLRGLQCEKSLWLKINNSDVLEDEDNAISQIFETGRKVGALACNLFPNGKRISFEDTVRDQRIALTKQWIVDGVSTIYEATFEFDGVLVMVDILNRDSNGNFEIYEVKSSSWNSKKKLKDIDTYIKDVSIQYYVLNGCGLNISKAAVTLLNGDYIRGDELDINDLFIHQIVTDEAISLQDRIPDTLESFRGTLNQQEKEPDIDIGWHCKKPYKCDASEYCWRVQRQIPEYSVFNIFPLTKKSKALELYHQGIVNIDEIPESFQLTDKQQLDVDASKSSIDKKPQINRDKLALFLSSLSYPFYYLDFETFQQPIPEFKGISPFQQIPFQYSVHVEQNNQTLEHKEFLGKEGSDPREQLVKQLIKDIPMNATILAFNASFEQMVLKGLAKQFAQYEDHLLSISENIIDIAIPFQKRYYYLPQMKGKHSIKIVLPLLVPEMAEAYKELDLVHDGNEAMQAFVILGEIEDPEKIMRIRKSLIEYCRLDTLAMFKILEKLKLV